MSEVESFLNNEKREKGEEMSNWEDSELNMRNEENKKWHRDGKQSICVFPKDDCHTLKCT